MQIVYVHASKYGNGARVAEEFRRIMAARNVVVNVSHVRDARPSQVAAADLYVFSSPGRMGKPIASMRRFLKRVALPAGTRYALLTTEAAAVPDKKTGRIPTEEESAKWHRMIPMMVEILAGRNMVNVAQGRIFVTGIKGPLEQGWERRVQSFAEEVLRVIDRVQ